VLASLLHDISLPCNLDDFCCDSIGTVSIPRFVQQDDPQALHSDLLHGATVWTDTFKVLVMDA